MVLMEVWFDPSVMVHVGTLAPLTSPSFKTYLLCFFFPSILFSALRGLIEQFKVILLQGPLIDFICVFSRGQGKGEKKTIKLHLWLSLSYSPWKFIAIYFFLVSFLRLSLFSSNFYMVELYMFVLFYITDLFNSDQGSL